MKAKVSRQLRQILADPEARFRLISSVLEADGAKDRLTIRAKNVTGETSYTVKVLGLRPPRKQAA